MHTVFEGKLAKFRIKADGRAVIVLDPSFASSPEPTATSLTTLQEVEKNHVVAVLSQSRTLEDAATSLGINLSTLWRKRRQYGIIS